MNYRFNKFELTIAKLRPLFFLEEYIYLNLILLYNAILKKFKYHVHHNFPHFYKEHI